MSGVHGPAPLTLDRRLGPGEVLRTGASAPYRALAFWPGEPHLVLELPGAGSPTPAAPGRAGTGRPLLVLAHVTDLQLADVQSPTRFEFLNREFLDPRFALIVPVQRPQESMTAHAIDATIRTLNRLAGGPVSAAPLELAVTTGDAIDNAQWNETLAFLRLFDGGRVRLGSGGPRYDGVQSLDWPDDIFWRPDGPTEHPDLFRREWGFPDHPGLLEAALAEFTAGGLDVPWLACFGNHEVLNQGVGIVTPALAKVLVGDRKATRLSAQIDRDEALELFTHHPEAFHADPFRPIGADPDRRAVSREEFVAAHFGGAARPDGHGFTEQNRADGTAYYVHDRPGVRMLGLDTTCRVGGADGCLDADQARWLQERLIEVHSEYRTAAGEVVRTGNDDALVVLFSHHGVATMDSANGHTGPGGAPALGGPELVAVLHRFPNVVLWLNGHTHINAVRGHRDPTGTHGFWEVTTCAIVDWPCQTRVVELLDNGDGTLSIVGTMLDHDSPLGPAAVPAREFSGDDFAALHRQIAGNAPWAGFDSGRAGTPQDRNVELRLPAPFPLSRLAGA
jgi:metallophosphoesterase (TIGR03767 family)